MKLTSNVVFAGVCASAMFGSVAIVAETVFEVPTAVSTSQVVNPNAGEFGQTIIFANQTEKLLTSFDISYNANYTRNAGLTIRFYDTDATGAPKVLLFQSVPQDIKSGFNSLSLAFPKEQVPATFTYTVEFNGVDAANTAGLLAPNLKPTTGFGYNDIWVNDGAGHWSTKVIPGGNFSFLSAKVSAVPEPSTYALVGLAGLALLGARRFRR